MALVTETLHLGIEEIHFFNVIVSQRFSVVAVHELLRHLSHYMADVRTRYQEHHPV